MTARVITTIRRLRNVVYPGMKSGDCEEGEDNSQMLHCVSRCKMLYCFWENGYVKVFLTVIPSSLDAAGVQ